MFLMLTVLLASGIPIQHDGVELVYSGSAGCEFVVHVEEPVFYEYSGSWYPHISGMGISIAAGDYIRPARTVHIPLPPGIIPELTCIPEGIIELSPPGSPAAAPVPSGSGLETVWTSPGSMQIESPGVYSDISVITVAGVSVAVVTVFPFPGDEFDRCPERIRVILRWDEVPGSCASANRSLEHLCLPGTVSWQRSSPARRSSLFWGKPWARMSLSAIGVYAVTGAMLDSAGIDILGVSTASLRMYSGPGEQFILSEPGDEHELHELSIEVSDDGDGVFGETDTLKFYGMGLRRFVVDDSLSVTRLHHRYAENNVYWLTWGGESGKRIETLSAMPDGSPFWGESLPQYSWQEQEYQWLPRRETTTGWVWTMLYNNIPAYFYFSTPSAVGNGNIAVSIITASSGEHELEFHLNGELLADTFWTGSLERIFEFSNLELDPTMNLLKVTSRELSDEIYFNYLAPTWERSLSYAANRPLIFTDISGRYTLNLGGAGTDYSLWNVTNPYAPVSIRGELTGDSLSISCDIALGERMRLFNPDSHLVPDSIIPESPGRILGTGIEGDVVIIVADNLLDTSGPLEIVYAMRGLDAVIVSTSEVYDEFGQGVRDPGAIRSFIRYTQDSWSEPPAAFVLVGDGSYDPLMYVTDSPTLIPVYIKLGYSNGWNMDDYYVIAHEGAALPEAPISRISAQTPGQLTDYLSKLMNYEARIAAGEWSNRVLLTADDEWGNGSANEVEHTRACELLADSEIPRSMDRVKFYMIEYPWPPETTPSGPHPEKPDAHEDFVEMLSQGWSTVFFFGHGSYGQIAHEKLLVSTDVQRIENGMRLPIMIFASCDVGHFDLISANSMSEDFELKSGSGSIASIGATRGTFALSNMYLFADYSAEYFSDGAVSCSEALWLGKLSNPSSYASNGLYVILGDGGVSNQKAEEMPVFMTIAGDSLQRGQLNTVTGHLDESTSGQFNITESGRETQYDCLGGAVIDYLRYGSSIYSSLITSENSDITAQFFMPIQADTGAFSRCSAFGLSLNQPEISFREWVAVYDSGEHLEDTIPPLIDMWLANYRGVEIPEVYGTIELNAELSDSSGICAMGGGAGRTIMMSLDSEGFDLGAYFSYLPNSYTNGMLEFTLPSLADGEHRIILAVWDGVGNTLRDTLDFTQVQAPEEMLSDFFVYPNPGDGLRCFNFRSAVAGTAEVAIYTVNGRAIWEEQSDCSQGYNQILWDGRDMDGDIPASGTYIYRINYTGENEQNSSVVDVFIIMHDG